MNARRRANCGVRDSTGLLALNKSAGDRDGGATRECAPAHCWAALRRYTRTDWLLLPTILAATLVLAPLGCVETPQSQYVEMSDGTRLAVDVWLPRPRPAEGVPTILRLGRYWRDYELPPGFPAIVGRYPTDAGWLNAAGYAVAMVDVRGTGASFGISTAPFSPQEVGDFPQLVDWILTQPWSNGRVGGMGVSYEGVTADWLGAWQHPAVKAVLPTYSYSDVYLDVSHPGGILNARFLRAWSDVTARMDRNDPSFLLLVAAANPRSLLAVFADAATALLLGVRPISGAADVLLDAISQHQNNPNVFEAAQQIEFRDDLFVDVSTERISPLLGAASARRSAAIRRVVGWLDAGTARGALSSFNTLDAPEHVVVLVPQTHTGDYFADPYYFGEPVPLPRSWLVGSVWQALPFFELFLRETPARTIQPDALETGTAQKRELAAARAENADALAAGTSQGATGCDDAPGASDKAGGRRAAAADNTTVADVFAAVGAATAAREVIYWTYVENVYKHTPVWPPTGFEMQRWYFGPGHTLSRTAPGGTVPAGTAADPNAQGLTADPNAEPFDVYTVDFEATSGTENRWFSGMSGLPIRYPDRAQQDQRLLVYDSPAFDSAVELTGHPVVMLQVAATETDGAWYAYLEEVFPDGRVVYLTEGELRGVQRQVSPATPPAAVFGPYHTFRRADAAPLPPGAPVELTFDLLPISTIIGAGHRLRIALAGHDADTFARIPAESTPTWRVYRSVERASYVAVPLRARPDWTHAP